MNVFVIFPALVVGGPMTYIAALSSYIILYRPGYSNTVVLGLSRLGSQGLREDLGKIFK